MLACLSAVAAAALACAAALIVTGHRAEMAEFAGPVATVLSAYIVGALGLLHRQIAANGREAADTGRRVRRIEKALNGAVEPEDG